MRTRVSTLGVLGGVLVAVAILLVSSVEAFNPSGASPAAPTGPRRLAAASCVDTFEDGTTQGWMREARTPSNSSYSDGTTRVVNSTARNNTSGGSHSVEADVTITQPFYVPPYTGAQGFVALPGAQPSGVVGFDVYPPTGTVVDPNAMTQSTVQVYVIGADGNLYLSTAQKLTAAAQWNSISIDLGQGFVGNGQVGANVPTPYLSAGIMFNLAISGSAQGSAVPIYVDDLGFSATCPQAFAVTPGQPATVAAQVGPTAVTLNVPSGEPIAQLALSTPPAPVLITPSSPTLQTIPGAAVVVTASDSTGTMVTQLAAPVGISMTFNPPSNINPSLAQIYTLDANGVSQPLATTDTASGAADTATALTPHFSPFVVYAPPAGSTARKVYLPFVISQHQN